MEQWKNMTNCGKNRRKTWRRKWIKTNSTGAPSMGKLTNFPIIFLLKKCLLKFVAEIMLPVGWLEQHLMATELYHRLFIVALKSCLVYFYFYFFKKWNYEKCFYVCIGQGYPFQHFLLSNIRRTNSRHGLSFKFLKIYACSCYRCSAVFPRSLSLCCVKKVFPHIIMYDLYDCQLKNCIFMMVL